MPPVPYPPLTRSPLPQWGRERGGGFAAQKEANPASLRSAAPSKGRGSRGCSLLPLEGGAPKGRRLEGESGIPDTLPSPRGEGALKGRIGYWRYERERERESQADDLREHPIHRWRGPPSPCGEGLYGGGFAEILRLRSQMFWHSLSHIRRFSPLRMTKRGDARKVVFKSPVTSP